MSTPGSISVPPIPHPVPLAISMPPAVSFPGVASLPSFVYPLSRSTSFPSLIPRPRSMSAISALVMAVSLLSYVICTVGGTVVVR